jgi:hypothetical protein
MSKFSSFNSISNSFTEESSLLLSAQQPDSNNTSSSYTDTQSINNRTYSTSSSPEEDESHPFLGSSYQTTPKTDIRSRKQQQTKKIMPQHSRLDENTSINIHDFSVDSLNDTDSMRRFIHEDEEVTKDYDKRTFVNKMIDVVLRRPKHFGRTIYLNGVTLPPGQGYSTNIVRNQKYSIISFIPLVLFEQFRFFFNLYFLIVAITQFIPALQVGMYSIAI